MVRTPEISSDVWFNSKPIVKDDLLDKVVLYDFWTYSCVNCLRTIPYLQNWWKKYKNEDFVMVGIHTPEFEFEKDPKNVEEAIIDLKIDWPVLLDNDYKNWRAFANRFWPAKYLTNKNGQIVYQHFGEGNYKETESKIRELLGLEDSKINYFAEHSHGSVCFVPTPEVYCGYGRGELSNRERYKTDKEHRYEKPEKIKDGTIGLFGTFFTAKEYVESKDEDSELFLRFHATEVNLVIYPSQDEVELEISFEGKTESPPNQIYGKNVDEKGLLKADKPAMYNLLRSGALMDGTLSIKPKKGNFKAYAFTFSGCEHN